MAINRLFSYPGAVDSFRWHLFQNASFPQGRNWIIGFHKTKRVQLCMTDLCLCLQIFFFLVLYFNKVFLNCGCQAWMSSYLFWSTTLAFVTVNWGRWCKRTCMHDSGFLASSVAVRLFYNEQKEQTVGCVFGRVRVPSLLGQLLPFRARLGIRAHMLTQDRSTIPLESLAWFIYTNFLYLSLKNLFRLV